MLARLFAIAILGLLLIEQSEAANEKGVFMTGGGVRRLECSPQARLARGGPDFRSRRAVVAA
jgi:hypothetical protein